MGKPNTVTPDAKFELIKLTPDEFRRIAALVYEQTGIHLEERKLTLLSNRLRKRVRALGLSGFEDYYALLQDPKKYAEELPEFLSAVTTNETYFFRNDRLWTTFRETWLPEAVKRAGSTKSIRIWSAASSSGEEAYTAAICLREDLPDFSTWRISIVGTDISKKVLDRAGEGVYTEYAVARMPEALRDKWFTRSERGYVIHPELRKLVRFQFHNLRDPMPGAKFDLVFLRNVLMYFDLAMKQQVLANVSRAVVPGGHVVIGDVDPVRNTPKLLECLGMEPMKPNWYRKPEQQRGGSPAGSR